MSNISVIKPYVKHSWCYSRDVTEKFVDDKWQGKAFIYTNYSTIVQRIIDCIPALIITIFAPKHMHSTRGWGNVFDGREVKYKVKFEEKDLKTSDGKQQSTIVMIGRYSTSFQTFIDLIAAVAVTIFSLGISLAFKGSRDMWSNVFHDRKIEHNIENAAWYASHWNLWNFVDKMLRANPKLNVDASPRKGSNVGKSIMWKAANDKKWALVDKMLDQNPNANVNVRHYSKGSVLNILARNEQWELVKKIVDANSSINVNGTPICRYINEPSVLWKAATSNQWDLVEKMLQLDPNADIISVPDRRYPNILSQIARKGKWQIIENMLEKTYSQEKSKLKYSYAILKTVIENRQYRLLQKMILYGVRKSLFLSEDQANIYTNMAIKLEKIVSSFKVKTPLPLEIRSRIAKLLFKNLFPELNDLPDNEISEILDLCYEKANNQMKNK